MRKKHPLYIPFLLLVILAASTAKAQEPRTSWSDMIVAPTYNYLYSTHKTIFQGVGLNAETKVAARTEVGLGLDFINCPSHGDNGLHLAHLHFVPLYGQLRYTLYNGRVFWPYAKMAIGETFMHYDEQDPAVSQTYFTKSEHGLYTYGGVGSAVRLGKYVDFFMDAGLVGYKMSFRDLDINPHGVTGKTGFLFIL